MWDRGFHEVTLLDMGDIAGPDVSIADLSLLRLQWPVPVVSSMARLQPELEQLRHVCKKRYHGTQADMCSFCGKKIKLDGVVVYYMEGYATILYGPPTSGTCSAGIRENLKLGKMVYTVDCQAPDVERCVKSAYSGVTTDVLLFSECGAPLVLHYRARGISHISLRGNYLTKLWTFVTQSEAVAVGRGPGHIQKGSDVLLSIRQWDKDDESPSYKARRVCSPRKSDVQAVPVSPMAASSRDLRSLLHDGRPLPYY